MAILFRMLQEDRQVRAVIRQMIKFGMNLEPAMEDLAVIGENTTRERFTTQIDPSGQRWKRSIRAQINGGKTLTKDGHLGDSITHRSDRYSAEWGTNRPYAPIHHFGGEIKPKDANNLRFRLANGAFITTKKVTMPKREILGVSKSDELDMLDALQARIEGVQHRAS